jgi:hypothetical protein
MDASVSTVRELAQHGITWTFSEPVRAGRFITGDWWVVGPATLISVSPKSGPLPPDASADSANIPSRYGAAAIRNDRSMRNGSMLNVRPGRDQGHDSRLKNYDPSLSVAFPFIFHPGDTLISTASNPAFPVPALLADLMWQSEKTAPLVLRSAAVLTCVGEPPPADAFRPPYAGGAKPVFRASAIRWDRLPRLAPAGEVPSWDQFERYFERPWLDHVTTWFAQNLGPSENQPCYGREYNRAGSIASLMLMLDMPRERREKLMIGFLQLGIDLHGLAAAGRRWPADGGHWNGRKWPVVFASLLIDDPRLALENLPSALVFSEDQQTYHGQGWRGQTALFQMVNHTGPKPPYEEKIPSDWDASDKLSERYRLVVSGGWPGTALAVLHLRAKSIWDHDAFFDYCDRWMVKDDAYSKNRYDHPRPKQEGRSLDPFVDAMWVAHRAFVPAN